MTLVYLLFLSRRVTIFYGGFVNILLCGSSSIIPFLYHFNVDTSAFHIVEGKKLNRKKPDSETVLAVTHSLTLALCMCARITATIKCEPY